MTETDITSFYDCITTLCLHLSNSHEDTHTRAHLRVFIVALGDLVVGDVDETHLPLLLLQLGVKDLQTEQIGLPTACACPSE